MSERAETGSPEGAVAAPAAESPEAAGDPTEPTVGTGSSLGIGCMVLMLLIFVVLAAVFFLPYFRR